MSTTIEREAVASFADLRLRPATLAALARMNIETPTPIQARALAPLLAGRDVIGQARTGSGKTLAFGIPAIEVVDPTKRAVQVLILTPTRELATQVGGVLDEVGASQGVTTALIFGGRAAGPQIAALRRGAQIVVGAPGRVLDLLNQGALSLKELRFLVLDEADEMLDRGFAPDVERILLRTPRSRQTSLFSATVPEWVAETAHKHLNDPVSVAVDPNPEDAAPIDHFAFELRDGDKLGALRDLLDERGDGSIIVFGRTKHGVKKLARQLQTDGYPVAALQGNLSQNARDKVMSDFRSGGVKILLATNVAARGLDITSVELVINVDLPESPELLTHRVGRTGRMGREGRAITLLAPEDGAKWRQLERAMPRRVPRAPWQGARAALDARIGAQPVTLSPAARAVRDTTPGAPVSRVIRNTVSAPVVRSGAPGAPRQSPPAADRTSRPATNGHRRSASQHAVVCSGCGQDAQVPFQPDPSRPVYCSACFQPRRRERRAV